MAPLFNSFWEPKLKLARLEKRDKPEASYGAGADSVKIEPGSTDKARASLSVFGPLVKCFGLKFLTGSFLKLIHDILVFASPILLRRIIIFSETDEPTWRGVVYATSLLLFALVQTILLSQYFYQMYLIGMWSKSSLISAIYRFSFSFFYKSSLLEFVIFIFIFYKSSLLAFAIFIAQTLQKCPLCKFNPNLIFVLFIRIAEFFFPRKTLPEFLSFMC